MSWQPTASLLALKQASLLRQTLRAWMYSHDILEVWTPSLSSAANTDPQVESLCLSPQAEALGSRYLHTSPEFAMKRLLCAYPDTDIYQIATVFRAEVQGRYHVSQFNMLEWYRVGMDHKALMRDTESLLIQVWHAFDLPYPEVQHRSYCNEVFQLTGFWPDDLQGSTVRDYFAANRRSFPQGLEHDLPACLDLFVDEFIISQFDANHITFLSEYPVSQAALARTGVNDEGKCVAERFEVYAGSVELANGFHELADAHIQRTRFQADVQIRKQRHQMPMPVDENLLEALEQGLPACAGIAMGIDRLLMVLGGYSHISDVLSFADANA